MHPGQQTQIFSRQREGLPAVLRCTPEVEVVEEEQPWAAVSGKRVGANRSRWREIEREP